MLISAGGQMIRIPVSDVRVISRNTQGVRLINLDEGDKLVSATPVEPEDETATADGDPDATKPGETPPQP